MGSITKRKMNDVKGNRYVLFQAEVNMKGQRYSQAFQYMREARAYISEQKGLISRGCLSGGGNNVVFPPPLVLQRCEIFKPLVKGVKFPNCFAICIGFVSKCVKFTIQFR